MSKKKNNKINDSKINQHIQDMEPNQFYQAHQSKLTGRLSFKEQFEFSEKQIKVLAAMMHQDTKIVFIEGVSGTSKSYLSVFAALKLLDQKKCSKIHYIRSLAESASKSIGALKGTGDEKFKPFMMPFEDKMEEILHPQSAQRVLSEQRINGTPVNFLRGASLRDSCVIIDEAQDFTFEELLTAITRIGEDSKFFVVGDPMQSDIGKKTGFKKMIDIFADDESVMNGIYHYKFGTEDIVRSGILKFIMEKVEESKKESMFIDDFAIPENHHRNNGHGRITKLEKIQK